MLKFQANIITSVIKPYIIVRQKKTFDKILIPQSQPKKMRMYIDDDPKIEFLTVPPVIFLAKQNIITNDKYPSIGECLTCNIFSGMRYSCLTCNLFSGMC